jgi:hypothetical protein
MFVISRFLIGCRLLHGSNDKTTYSPRIYHSLKIKTLLFFVTSRYVKLRTIERNISKKEDSQNQCCRNLKSLGTKYVHRTVAITILRQAHCKLKFSKYMSLDPRN